MSRVSSDGAVVGGVQEKELDFFILSEPAWLDSQFPKEAAQVRRPCVALISTDKTWITCALKPKLHILHPSSASTIDIGVTCLND